ncbi:MAG: acyl-CoA dehydrogenase family protein [Hyphomicrobiaceae bacterium]
MQSQQGVTANPQVLGRAQALCEVLRTARGQIEAGRELPAQVVGALHDARMFRLLLPRAVGGEEIDLVTMAEVTRLIAAADASTAWCLGQGGGCAMTASFLEPEAAKRLFGPANAVLAWGAGVQGTAVEEGNGYRISGRWTFASGSRHATLLGAHCKIVGANGKPRLRADGRPADLTALFPRAKAEMDDIWHVVGLKGTGSDSYEVKDLFVAASDTVDREDMASAKVDGTLFKFPNGMAYSAAFGGVSLGIARGMLDDLTALATQKTPRGASSSLLDSGMFQGELGRLEARWRAARALLLETVGSVWSDVDAGSPLTLQHRVDWRLAATHAINEACQVSVEAYRAAGQNAIFQNAPFEQRLRDAMSAAQQVQGRATHFMTVGRHLLGLEPDTMMFL